MAIGSRSHRRDYMLPRNKKLPFVDTVVAKEQFDGSCRYSR